MADESSFFPERYWQTGLLPPLHLARHTPTADCFVTLAFEEYGSAAMKVRVTEGKVVFPKVLKFQWLHVADYRQWTVATLEWMCPLAVHLINNLVNGQGIRRRVCIMPTNHSFKGVM